MKLAHILFDVATMTAPAAAFAQDFDDRAHHE